MKKQKHFTAESKPYLVTVWEAHGPYLIGIVESNPQTFQIEFNRETLCSVARIYVSGIRTSAFIPVYNGKWLNNPGLTEGEKKKAVELYDDFFNQPF